MVVSSESQQEKGEQAIFRLFVKAAGVRVVQGSIRSGKPPAPDILCAIHGRGPVDFELVEIVTQAFRRETADRQKLEEVFKEACEQHPEMGIRYQNARIYVGFKHAPLQQRLKVKVVPDVVDVLLERQRRDSFEGSVTVPSHLKKIICEISVTRHVQTTGVTSGPMFCVMKATLRTEEIVKQIEKKCNKRYEGDHPIELLAYYSNQPSSDHFNWKGRFHDDVVKKLSESECPFKRVWVYDCWKPSILYVHPPLLSAR